MRANVIMRAYVALACLTCLLLVSGCAQLQQWHAGNSAEAAAVHLPPLPPLDNIDCCWQRQEQLSIHRADGDIEMISIIERQPEQLSVVILDSLGHRQLTLRYSGGEMQTLSAPPDWSKQYSRYLLVSLFLHHHQGGVWVAENSDWIVDINASGDEGNAADQKILRYKGANTITLTYNQPLNALAQTRIVQIAEKAPFLTVSTLANTPL
jgi:hypothetical protein